jgi:hypothetical protein
MGDLLVSGPGGGFKILSPLETPLNFDVIS